MNEIIYISGLYQSKVTTVDHWRVLMLELQA